MLFVVIFIKKKQFLWLVWIFHKIPNIENPDIETETKIYSHVFYPESYVVPDLTGTSVKLRGNTDKKERCTPVRFNRKIRMDVGNQKIRFGNMPEVINGINRVIEETA